MKNGKFCPCGAPVQPHRLMSACMAAALLVGIWRHWQLEAIWALATEIDNKQHPWQYSQGYSQNTEKDLFPLLGTYGILSRYCTQSWCPYSAPPRKTLINWIRLGRETKLVRLGEVSPEEEAEGLGLAHTVEEVAQDEPNSSFSAAVRRSSEIKSGSLLRCVIGRMTSSGH